MEHKWTFPATLDGMPYDGDTISLYLDLGFGCCLRASVRIDGLDTPEIRRGKYSTDLTRALAYRARDEGHAFIAAGLKDGKSVIFHSLKGGTGKYGRPLGQIYVDDDSYTEWMISEGLGVAYTGGSRAEAFELHKHNAQMAYDEGLLDSYLEMVS